MCAVQRIQPPEQEQNRQPPEPNYRFRWEVFLGIPLLVLAFLWLLQGIDPSFEFDDVMDALSVAGRDQYVHLACLGALLIAIILIVKAIHNNHDS